MIALKRLAHEKFGKTVCEGFAAVLISCTDCSDSHMTIHLVADSSYNFSRVRTYYVTDCGVHVRDKCCARCHGRVLYM